MHWLKHFCNASDDEFIEELESEFGLEGYARWWKMLEIIGRGMDKKHPLPSASHSIEKWCQFLQAKPKKLGLFLEHSENKLRINVKRSGGMLTITCPKLLELKDEYYRKSGQTPDSVRQTSVSVSDSVFVSKSSIQEERKKVIGTVGEKYHA